MFNTCNESNVGMQWDHDKKSGHLKNRLNGLCLDPLRDPKFGCVCHAASLSCLLCCVCRVFLPLFPSSFRSLLCSSRLDILPLCGFHLPLPSRLGSHAHVLLLGHLPLGRVVTHTPHRLAGTMPRKSPKKLSVSTHALMSRSNKSLPFDQSKLYYTVGRPHGAHGTGHNVCICQHAMAAHDRSGARPHRNTSILNTSCTSYHTTSATTPALHESEA
jgi:hypothetical protein